MSIFLEETLQFIETLTKKKKKQNKLPEWIKQQWIGN